MVSRLSPEDRGALDPDFARVAARLKAMREERGQTLDELAATSALSKTYLSRLESAERQPSLAALFALARAWDVPVGMLLQEEDDVADARVLRHAAVEWLGGSEGHGYVRVGSGSVEGGYTQATRLSGEGLNPEELIGAAHAACFAMSLAAMLTDAGHPPESLSTNADVHGHDGGGEGFRITRVELHVRGRVPGLSPAAFGEYAQRAKRTCTISRTLTGVEISLHAELAD